MKTRATRSVAAKTTSIRLQTDIQQRLDELARKGFVKSVVINDALKRYMMKLELEELRERITPMARAKGIFTEDDVMSLLDENNS